MSPHSGSLIVPVLALGILVLIALSGAPERRASGRPSAGPAAAHGLQPDSATDLSLPFVWLQIAAISSPTRRSTRPLEACRGCCEALREAVLMTIGTT
jgi:hypothetical protein